MQIDNLHTPYLVEDAEQLLMCRKPYLKRFVNISPSGSGTLEVQHYQMNSSFVMFPDQDLIDRDLYEGATNLWNT